MLDTLFTVKRLIVNADDFGLTPGINRAILELHDLGVLPSATLMAAAGSFESAVRAVPACPALGIGCHVTLVDGNPLLPPDQLPRLALGAAGAFRPAIGSFIKDILLGRIPEREIEAEATAQIRRLQMAGIAVTHVDTHKHTHMFSGVLRPLLRAAAACGISAIRNPFEPDWSLRATPNGGLARRLQVKALRSMQGHFLKATRRAGFATTDGSIGILATGTLDTDTLHSLLAALPEGVWELCCHPGYHDTALNGVRTRLRESREIERRALLEAVPAAAGISLIHFGHLAQTAGAAN